MGSFGTNCEACGKSPKWIKPVLMAAGAYNIVFGLWAILLPAQSLSVIGFDGSIAQSRLLWSCIGMIVGVYGIGYLLAANRPLTLWPLILVGLLGKIFGPVGYVYGVATGQAPVEMGFILIFNDLIWWVPFGLILWRAAREIQNGDQKEKVEPDTPQMLEARFASAIAHTGESIADYSTLGHGAMVVFVRQAGCLFCRQMLDELRQKLPMIQASGLTPVVVHQSSAQEANQWLEKVLPGVARVSDEPRILYRAVGLRRGDFLELLGPGAWAGGVKAMRHGVGRLQGDGFQMPGVLVVRHGKVIYRQDFAHVGQCVNWQAVLDTVNAETLISKSA